MAAPVYQSFAENKTTSGTSNTCNKPSGVVSGDLMIAHLSTDGSEVHSGPSGWQVCVHKDQGTACTGSFWWKIAGGSEPSNYQFTWGTSEASYLYIMRFTGADDVQPIDIGNFNDGSSSSPNCPDITTITDDTLLLRSFTSDDDDITVDGGNPSGTTIITADESGTGSFSCAGGSAHETQATAGATGAATWTLTASEQWVAMTIAIVPPIDTTGCPVIESTTISTQESDSSSITINMPSTRPDGDLYVCIVGKDDDDNFGGVDADWNEIVNVVGSTTSGPRMAAWQWIGASEPASYSVTFTADQAAAIVYRISGMDDTTPVHKSATGSSTGSSNDPAYASVTPTLTDTLTLYGQVAGADNYRSPGASHLLDSIENGPTDPVIFSHRFTQSTSATPVENATEILNEAYATVTVNIAPGTTTQDISPTGIASAEAFGTATISPGAVDISPTGIASAEAFGTPLITHIVEPTGIASAEAFGSHTVVPGVVQLGVTGIASAEAFGSHTITPGAVDISPTGIASAEAFGTTQLNLNIEATGIASAEAFGTAVITPGAVDISPTGIASAEAFGSHTISLLGVEITPTGIASAEAFGTALITHIVEPTGIASAEAFGSHTLTATYEITVGGIASAEAVPTPVVGVGAVDIAPSSIPSGEAFGTHVLTHIIDVTGIASAEAFGSHTVTPQTDVTVDAGIPSAEAFGSHLITGGSFGSKSDHFFGI